MQIYKVGGAVRDRLLGRPVTEVDWVVVGASAEQMQALGFRPVGADFPVFLHPKTGEEYALARTERKSGRGYGGFTFYASPDVTLEDDLIRRDLTINAMAEDEQGRLIDPYNGQADLAARTLRHVSPAFAEDPLRVLRVARFAARYAHLGFSVADETLVLMRQLAESGELQALTPERCWKEISRALMEPRPDIFIQVLRDCGALAVLLPEIDTLFVSSQHERLFRVLRHCAEQAQPLPIRWACLLHPLEQDTAGPDSAQRLIEAVNTRYKVPRECQELALLVGKFQGQAQRAQELSAAALFELLQHFDIHRRPERFEQFIAACEMITLHEGAALSAQSAHLREAADAVRAVEVKALIAQGYQGAELGEALKRERLKAVEHFAASRR
ncbi:multifunctional CCA addition/repair protein [Stutzerimonas stutzeri]|uniref:multifunctional CCA addition/repair protein n=1 Tax=Stutzerimonas stutzeri TaxID=316 RepID=UPI00265AFCE9|nr:multifunctional CCA addition/repair protein [Stutzerimonas stutzeri]MCF6781394.1 multifunctional CCA addition/repair protein [Stutzerimonas stutzeri]MCF6806559.1 multifunctional CCA addition/repair protein [Stutzerimonas stutzeri]